MSRRRWRFVLRRNRALARCSGQRSGASRKRSRSRPPALRAASLMSATRSGESQRPWAKASAIPRLPRSSFGHVREDTIRTVAAGGPEPYTRRSSPSTTSRLPTLIRRSRSDTSQRESQTLMPVPPADGGGRARPRASAPARVHRSAPARAPSRAGNAAVIPAIDARVSSRRRSASVASNTVTPARLEAMWTDSVWAGSAARAS